MGINTHREQDFPQFSTKKNHHGVEGVRDVYQPATAGWAVGRSLARSCLLDRWFQPDTLSSKWLFYEFNTCRNPLPILHVHVE
jgi:hypothetical protein